MGVPFSFDTRINVIAFLFSAGIGVLFGYLPARRAAQLDPIGTTARITHVDGSSGVDDSHFVRHHAVFGTLPES